MPWRHLSRRIIYLWMVRGAITAVAGYLVTAAIDFYIRKRVGELSVPIRSVQQSRIYETQKGPARVNKADPVYDQIDIPSRFKDDPSLTIPSGKAGILFVNANASTAYDLSPRDHPIGIGFRLDIFVNGEACSRNATQSTLVGNRPALSATCVVALHGGRSHTIQVKRDPHGAFINNPDPTYLQAQYSLVIFDETPQ